MYVYLNCIGGASKLGRKVVDRSPFLLGRDPASALSPPGDDSVSRKHCEIILGDGLLTIRDCGSKNGTFLNGVVIEAERTLQHGDRIGIGGYSFTVEISEGPVTESSAMGITRPLNPKQQ